MANIRASGFWSDALPSSIYNEGSIGYANKNLKKNIDSREESFIVLETVAMLNSKLSSSSRSKNSVFFKKRIGLCLIWKTAADSDENKKNFPCSLKLSFRISKVIILIPGTKT